MPTVLRCDSCPAATTDVRAAGAWFVFHDADGPGNARCPDCLPDQVGGDVLCLL